MIHTVKGFSEVNETEVDVFLELPSFRHDPKNVPTTIQFALFSHTSKAMLKILQASLQKYVNCEFTDVQTGSRKVRGTKLPTPVGS